MRYHWDDRGGAFFELNQNPLDQSMRDATVVVGVVKFHLRNWDALIHCFDTYFGQSKELILLRLKEDHYFNSFLPTQENE